MHADRRQREALRRLERSQNAPGQRRRRPGRRRARAAAAGIAVAVTLGACGSATKQPPPASSAGIPPAAAQPADAFARIPQIVRNVQPSIVTVFAERGEGRGGAGQGVGSGVIYRADGVILTNHHVVADAARLEIALADGSRVGGHVIATDPDTDLAVIRVDRKALIQTDAAISPGNSGGAIVDGNGRVLGISVTYVPPQQGAVAVGFAIPAATATRVADELLEHGRARHAYLGLQPAALTPDIARALQVNGGGVLVYALAPEGPAAQAGIRPGDVVTALGEQKLTSVEELFAALRQHDPGERVAISYLREGKSRAVQAQITDQPS